MQAGERRSASGNADGIGNDFRQAPRGGGDGVLPDRADFSRRSAGASLAWRVDTDMHRLVDLIRAIVVATVAALLIVRAAAAPGGLDVATYHYDAARTGQNLSEATLTPATVNASVFGRAGFFATDGKVDAQPLYLSSVSIPGQGTRNVLYVATEHGTVYAFDATTGTTLWQLSLLGAGETPSDARNCSQVVPEIGITATPVIDRSRGPNGALYVVAMSKNPSGTYFQRLHALDVTTGAELFGGPRLVQASSPGSGAGSVGGVVAFDPKQYEERAALLLVNGQLILTWTSHCDIDPYTGWIMSYDPNTLVQASVLNLTPNGSRGAVWMAGAGPAADAAGNVYLLDGNGTFDTALDGNGFPSRGNFGNAFLKISTSGGLRVADYFASFDTVAQSNADVDLGSGGLLLLPDVADASGRIRRLAVGAGKDRHIYVVDRDAMGKWNGAANLVYQDLTGSLAGPVFSKPAYFNGTLYYGAAGDSIKAFPLAAARVAAAPSSRTARTFIYPGATPTVSASGAANGIVWAVENSNPAVLHAYDAADLSRELYHSSQAAGGRDAFGPGNKFITPMVANGRVYVGTTTGVAVFGSLIPTAPTNVRIIPSL
jgi:outer membrane protein assembly factor BamB